MARKLTQPTPPPEPALQKVMESLKGKKVGHELVETAVNYARNQGIKIIPLCPFARSLFSKRKEWEDVLYKERNSTT